MPPVPTLIAEWSAKPGPRAAAAACALVLALPAALLAQTSGGAPREARPAVAAAPPVVDGVLTEAAWADAPLLDGFVQREPTEGRPSSEPTEVRVLVDADALYVGAWMYDSRPDGLVVGETRRDADPTDSDAVILVLDTYRDRQNGFLFATTPAGVEYDGQITKEGAGGGNNRRQVTGSGGGFNVNWDGAWTVATSRDERGWYAEFRIPFTTLRYAGAGPQTWGFNVTRRIRRNNEEVFWSPVARQFDVYRVSDAGVLTGFDAPGRRSATVTPYVLGLARRDYTPTTGPDDSSDADWGVDAKFVSASSLTLDLTYNTDFAQVEVDDEEVNLTRFRLFFPEKRPFFLENAGTFSVGTPQDAELFFSRRIGIENGRAVPIVGGGRLTGRVGGFTIGVLDIQTDDVEGLVDPLNFAVVRAMKELPNRTRFGGTVVNVLNTRDTGERNVVYAADGRLGVGSALTLDGYVAGSSTPRVDGDEVAFSTSASWNSRDWQVSSGYLRVGEGFRAEAGFIPRGAHQSWNLRVMRRVRFEGVPWFRELRPHISAREHLSLDGFSETRLLHFDSHFEFSNGAFFQLPAINLTREGLRAPFEIADGVVVPPGTYDNVDWGFAYNTNLSAPFSVQGRIDVGGFYDGFRYGHDSNLNVRVSDVFVAGLRYAWFDVDLEGGEFTTSVVGLRAAYSFTPRIYLQSLLQYNDQTDTFSGNVRFGWLNTAGTGLFIVYNDLRNTAPFAERGLPEGPLDRQLVIKFTRQFDLFGG